MFKAYPKIHRLGKEETDGILESTVTIQEKIDGANTSIWLEDGNMHMASRSQEKTEGFNGFVDYVNNNKEISKLLEDNPDYRLYGEWLVRHTISYSETSYRKFYMFDILDGDKWLSAEDVAKLAEEYSIPRPQIFVSNKKLTVDEIKEFVGKTELGEKGEGIVIKCSDFVNKFGDQVHAKIVSEKFKEDNAITFGGNNKHAESYWEMYVVNKYATLARVKKIMHKIQPLVDHRLDMPDIPRVTSTCYHDMMSEEIWEIQKKVPELNFRRLRNFSVRKYVQIYKDILNEHISIADRDN